MFLNHTDPEALSTSGSVCYYYAVLELLNVLRGAHNSALKSG